MTAADRIPGTGLGLSICEDIIEAHGGRIWAEDLPGGMAFKFTLAAATLPDVVILDLAQPIVTRDGAEAKLTATEFSVLAYVAANAGRVLTRRSILEHVWGWAEGDNVEYLRVYMVQLRKKLEDDPRHPHYLLTEPGVGYRFMT